MSITCFINIFGQSDIKISQPELKFVNDRLIIKYDILGVKQDDRFIVQLEITDTTGKEIKASSLYGDIGENVSGTSPKQIIWDMAADSIYLNIGLSIEIYVTRIATPKTLVAVIKDTTLPVIKIDSTLIEKQEVIENDEEFGSSYNKSVKMGSNLLLSTLLPGLGLTRLSEGKPYWLLGVVGYGCIASSVYLNERAASNYEKYLDSQNEVEWTAYFNTGQKQYNTSKALAWSTAAIWVADLGITCIKAVKMKNTFTKGKLMSLYIRPSFSTYANVPLMSLTFAF